MTYLVATVHTLGLQLWDRSQRARDQHRDTGAITIEWVLWGIAAIAIAGIVIAVITNYVRNKSAQIQ